MAEWIGIIGGLAGLAALGRTEWVAWHRRKVPPEGLGECLVSLRDALDDVVNGGRPSSWFLEPERKQATSRLALLSVQIVDDQLNALVGEARAYYNTCFAVSGADNVTSDPRRVQMQVDAAHEGVTKAEAAITRLGLLTRKGA